jgi:predicted membrane protein
MDNDINTEQQPIPPLPPRHNNGKVIAGFILLVVGGLLLINQIGGYILPWWLFRWPMILIAVGLYSAARHNFQKPSSFILVVIGCIFLLGDIFPNFDAWHMLWPLIIIAAGITMILRRNQKWDRTFTYRVGTKEKRKWQQGDWGQQYTWDKKVTPDDPNPSGAATNPNPGLTDYSNINYSKIKSDFNEDYLDATSIFGSANKTILSKNFKGGEIVNIFGGAEIDFTQADIHGRVVIDVTQIFGGIKLLVPPHWHVTSDTVSLFAGLDDKRRQKADLNNEKILIITGTSIFAGIEIRSY